MIGLAANGNGDLYELLDADRAPVDYIKCPVSPESRAEVVRARKYRPVVLHCWGPAGYSATWPEIPEPELLADLAVASGTPFLSVHLDYQPAKDGALERDALLERVRRNVATLREISGLDVLLENVPWYSWRDRPRLTTDPDFITEAVISSGAGLLVDTAHARVAAWHRGEEIERYLASLPLDRAREVHTSGPRMAENGLRDFHLALQDEDYRVLGFILDRAPQVQLVTCEYVGWREKTAHFGENDGVDRLAMQLRELRAFLDSRG